MAILMTKLKNAVRKHKPECAQWCFNIRNININGVKRGCSGFIHSHDDGTFVYVNTEPSCIGQTMLVRNAQNEKDYRGFTNHHVKTLEELVSLIYKLMKNPEQR